MARNIREYIKIHVRSKADLISGKIIAPMPGGNWLGKRDGCSTPFLVAPGQGSKSYAPGLSVNFASVQGSRDRVVATLPPPGRRGISSFPALSLEAGNLDGLVVLSANPSILEPGDEDIEVILKGEGFIENPLDIVTCVLSDDETPNPYINADGVVEFISSKEVKILVSVDASIPNHPVWLNPYFSFKRG
jgi:hypothetical protein